MRVENGAVVDEFDLPGIGQVVARHTRIKTVDTVSWACLFTVVAPGNTDLAIVHRLSAPTLAEARRSVRQAVEFLAGRAAAEAAADRRPDVWFGGTRPERSVAGTEHPKRTPDPQRGVVPAFRLPAAPAPTDHLPAPLS